MKAESTKSGAVKKAVVKKSASNARPVKPTAKKSLSKNFPKSPPRKKDFTIGVFDSGFGGLTVLRALLPLVPGARFVYLGDTARLPYGSKSRETIVRYAAASARLLQSRGADLLVIACNTASALALDVLESTTTVPVIGVVQPGAKAARAASETGDVIVLATTATVESGAYSRACTAEGLRSVEKACPLLVPLVEEGWTDHAVTQAILRIYLMEALAAADASLRAPDVVLLGCTHYPLLRDLIEQTAGQLARKRRIRVIDSAEATAERVAKLLSKLRVPKRVLTRGANTSETHLEFLATDSIEKFRRIGSRFLGREITNVEHVDLGE
jgi:glutamate racemase